MNDAEGKSRETIIARGELFRWKPSATARGLDELTNHVVSITNFWRDFDTTTEPWTPAAAGCARWLPATRSYVTSATVPNDAFPLTNGAYIVGLLSKPKLDGINNTTVRSNHVVAVVRAFTGAASDKYPQTNVSVLDLLDLPHGGGGPQRAPRPIQRVTMPKPCGRTCTNSGSSSVGRCFPATNSEGRQTFRTMAGGQILTAQPNGQPVFFSIRPPINSP